MDDFQLYFLCRRVTRPLIGTTACHVSNSMSNFNRPKMCQLLATGFVSPIKRMMSISSHINNPIVVTLNVQKASTFLYFTLERVSSPTKPVRKHGNNFETRSCVVLLCALYQPRKKMYSVTVQDDTTRHNIYRHAFVN